MSLKTFGAAAFRAAVEHGLALAEHARGRARGRRALGGGDAGPARRRHLPAVAARRRGRGGGRALRGPAGGRARDGFAFVSSHVVGGRPVLRLCTINPRTTREDVEATIDRLGSLAEGAPR